MLSDIKIEAVSRVPGMRRPTRKLAREGQVAGILYGGKEPPVTFMIDPRKLDPILGQEGAFTTLFNFSIEGKEGSDVVLIREIQSDPVTGDLLHADLLRIDMTKQIQVDIPVHLIGISKGVKLQGGVLDFVQREIEIKCLPGDIPERIDADVSELDLGMVLKVSDLKIPENVKVITDPNTPIASVVAPAAEKAAAAEETAEAAAAAAAPTEPEVIPKGKGEAEEGGAKGGGKEGEGGEKGR